MFNIKYRLDSFTIKYLKEDKTLKNIDGEIIDGMFEITINDFSEGCFCEDKDVDGCINIRLWAYMLYNVLNILPKNKKACFNLWEGEKEFFCFELHDDLLNVKVCKYDDWDKCPQNFYKVEIENPITDYWIIYETEIDYNDFNEKVKKFLNDFRRDILALNKNIPKNFKW